MFTLELDGELIDLASAVVLVHGPLLFKLLPTASTVIQVLQITT